MSVNKTAKTASNHGGFDGLIHNSYAVPKELPENSLII
jgi:hypothetical protein